MDFLFFKVIWKISLLYNAYIIQYLHFQELYLTYLKLLYQY